MNHKRIIPFLVAGLMLGGAGVSSAQQAAPTSIEELWQIVQKQQAQIEALQRQNAVLADQVGSKPELLQEQSVAAVAPVTKSATPTAVSGNGTVAEPGQDASFEIFGFAQLDAIHDFNRTDPNWNAATRPSKIPVVDPAVFGSDGETILSVRYSRIGMRSSTPTPLGDVKVLAEWDLFANGGDAGKTELNLRHFYGELGNWGAGHYWTNFMDIDIFPNTIDYWGPSGMIFVRKPQLRYTLPLSGGSHLAFTLEDPGSDVDAGIFRDIDPGFGDAIATKDSLPDLIAKYRTEHDWGHFQAAGLLRRLEFETLSDGSGSNPSNSPDGSATGWGIDLTSVINTTEMDRLKMGLVFGDGIASYFNDGGTAMAPHNNRAEAVPSVGISVFYDRYWNQNWSTSVGWSRHEQDNTNQQTDDAMKIAQLAQINLLYTEGPFLTGLEAIWSERENKDGMSEDAFRLQYSVKYNFDKKW